jgi:hypothetical protein
MTEWGRLRHPQRHPLAQLLSKSEKPGRRFKKPWNSSEFRNFLLTQ